ncbi:MAG: trypsin-like peptidase domain-containing protein [Thermoguttaceae bacterium]
MKRTTFFFFALLLLTSVARFAAALESRANWATRAFEKNCNAVVCIQGDKIDEFTTRDSGKAYNGMGTGILIDERGYIVTNFHVIDGIRKIQVTTFDRKQYTATIVARDPDTDLAIIKITGRTPFQTITLGRSDDLKQGENCMAIGNPYGYDFSLTDGRISGINREVDVNDSLVYRVAIQTNTEINPGNSGGPLINVDGEMIGLNAAIRQGAAGIAFAIPVDQVINVAAKLIGEQAERNAFHGVKVRQELMQNGTPNFIVIVESVESNSPAADAGVQVGDIIERIGEYKISNTLDFSRALIDLKAREDVVFVVRRSGDLYDRSVSLGAPREDALARTVRRPTTPSVSRSIPAAKTSNSVNPSTSPKNSSLDDLVWQVLGFSYTPMSKEEYKKSFALYLNDYPYGGVVIQGIREGSAASELGVMPGDVIIGIHEWVTTSQNDVRYIAKNWSTLKSSSGKVKLLLFRDGLPYFTELPLK